MGVFKSFRGGLSPSTEQYPSSILVNVQYHRRIPIV